MKFILDEEPEIVEPLPKSEDKAIVKLPTNTGKKVPRYSDEQKEKIANDVLNGMTGKEVAAIYGVTQPLANAYARGEGLDGDVKAKVLAKRFDIADVASVKLMDTLNLINPAAIKKERDKAAVAVSLATIVDKVTGNNAQTPNKVEIHLYSPNQKKETDYDVIEVAS